MLTLENLFLWFGGYSLTFDFEHSFVFCGYLTWDLICRCYFKAGGGAYCESQEAWYSMVPGKCSNFASIFNPRPGGG